MYGGWKDSGFCAKRRKDLVLVVKVQHPTTKIVSKDTIACSRKEKRF
jgi:hypothetical protein